MSFHLISLATNLGSGIIEPMKIIAYSAWDAEFNLVKFDTEAEAIEFCGDPDRVIPIIKTEEIIIEKEDTRG